MRNLDFAPLFRSTVGFDHLVNLLDAAARSEQQQTTYPPYNIERISEDKYRISMAVAGFTQADISIVCEKNTLSVTGKQEADNNKEYLYRGIAGRNFERKFQLADHVEVVGASLENGLLHIDLVREIPEAMKPRNIEIQSGFGEHKVLEAQAEKVA